MLKRTPFYDFHVSAGAKMVDFAGWEMPLLYRSIADEHVQTRQSGSMFDVSHMGRLHFTGPDAVKFLGHVATRRLSDQKIGQSRYSLICNESGGVMDDVIIGRDVKNWVMVCNASNREKLVKYFNETRRATGMDFDMADQTESTGMLAMQGPKIIERLASVLPVDLAGMKRYGFESGSYMLIKFTVFRTGYTGEDGIELVLPAKMAGMAMKLLGGKMDREDATIKPAGLGARDTLRLEAAMPLYGHELSETIDPLSAGLGWAVDLEKDFVGAGALREIKEKGVKRRRVGLVLEGRRIARQGMGIWADGKVVGEITSGTFGPTVQKSIAMGYVDAGIDGPLEVAIKETERSEATIVGMPFYSRQ